MIDALAQVLSAKLCLRVASDNNGDSVWFRWHFDTTVGSEEPSHPWSDVKAMTPAAECSKTYSGIELENSECGVACKCLAFEAVSSTLF
jgi:hypothetical protein